MNKSIVKKLTFAGALMSLTACGTLDKVSSIGQAPEFEPIENIKAPVQSQTLGRTIPRAKDQPEPRRANSLWRTGARAFFKDQRASRIGDILTVNIDIQDQAQIGNTTSRTRQSTEDAGLPSLLGLETLLPSATNPSSLVSGSSGSTYAGNGSVNRSETINMTVAAIVTDVLPNGNLVIQARQEVRVNFEKRELMLAGIIRPEDISAQNIIQHTQIAEARISYGGEGQITDVQQARYGAQLYDILFPF